MNGKALGVRVETEVVYWAVVEGSSFAPILVAEGKLLAPVSSDEAGRLVALRRGVLDLLLEHKPNVVFVRFPESSGFARKGELPRRRSRIEGVMMEAAASQAIPVMTGPLVTIGKGLGLDAKAAKAMRDSAADLRGIDWAKCDEWAREAILAATSALG